MEVNIFSTKGLKTTTQFSTASYLVISSHKAKIMSSVSFGPLQA
jgi:hypothetical protein